MPSAAPSVASESAVLGIIAGEGDIPRLIAEAARRQGRQVVAVPLSPGAAQLLESAAHTIIPCGVGEAKKIISTLHEQHARQVVLAGKVHKRLIFERPRFDLRALSMLRKVRRRDDGSLLTLVVEELEGEGIEVLEQTTFLGSFLTPSGCLTKRRPSRQDWRDIRYGVEVARSMADLEVGQTVVIKNTTILAIEAIEGTDEAIRRGAALAKGAPVVVKVSRSRQDFRFDIPAVGIQTLQSLIDCGGRVLAIEAERTLLLERAEFVRQANRAGISVVGVSGDAGNQ